ncbi:MAG: TetR/AcrR family transcriptional regulator [Pseudomonadota bacterium]
MTKSSSQRLVETPDFSNSLDELQAQVQRMNPNPESDDGIGWQEKKSCQTRVALLKATVACLSEAGYARTTTQLVAKQAGISRGAMLHHYATKADLIAGAADYIMYRRLDDLYQQIVKLSDRQRVDEMKGLEIYWSSIVTEEYQAFLELLIASRTDPELEKVFIKKARTYDDYAFSLIPKFFPEWSKISEDKSRLARDFVFTAFEGLHINHALINDRKRRVAVRELIKTSLQTLLRSEDNQKK